LKKYYPDAFERVKKAVALGRFEVVGGSWVECDGNVPSGESMIRQLLYGQRFAREELGAKIEVFFLPDTFGYSPQIPQIVKSAGIKYFLTQKLSWSCHNKFPHSTFIWKGIDGTEILTHFPPADTYNSNGSVEELLMSHTNFKDKGRSNMSLLLFGDGDGGGGPQLEHLERLQRATKDFDGLPKVKMATCH
jgi:alpha-mannosidase